MFDVGFNNIIIRKKLIINQELLKIIDNIKKILINQIFLTKIDYNL
jgi:hypothetical protein